jgi:3'-phosphoadenosine 5'-phosphosulfate (PAPS) 3'-phosphatase
MVTSNSRRFLGVNYRKVTDYFFFGLRPSGAFEMSERNTDTVNSCHVTKPPNNKETLSVCFLFHNAGASQFFSPYFFHKLHSLQKDRSNCTSFCRLR